MKEMQTQKWLPPFVHHLWSIQNWMQTQRICLRSFQFLVGISSAQNNMFMCFVGTGTIYRVAFDVWPLCLVPLLYMHSEWEVRESVFSKSLFGMETTARHILHCAVHRTDAKYDDTTHHRSSLRHSQVDRLYLLTFRCPTATAHTHTQTHMCQSPKRRVKAHQIHDIRICRAHRIRATYWWCDAWCILFAEPMHQCIMHTQHTPVDLCAHTHLPMDPVAISYIFDSCFFLFFSSFIIILHFFPTTFFCRSLGTWCRQNDSFFLVRPNAPCVCCIVFLFSVHTAVTHTMTILHVRYAVSASRICDTQNTSSILR